MADDMLNADGSLNTEKYYLRPGCTEPELRPEFAKQEAAPAEEEDLESLKKTELLEMAEEKGVDAKQRMSKAEIIELIEADGTATDSE